MGERDRREGMAAAPPADDTGTWDEESLILAAIAFQQNRTWLRKDKGGSDRYETVAAELNKIDAHILRAECFACESICEDESRGLKLYVPLFINVRLT